MMDPPREESKAAVAECVAAGIRPDGLSAAGCRQLTAQKTGGLASMVAC